jgi:sec-independent protein translocase protein TatB
MDFMGIGPFELILILILAFLFFGPEKLPGMASKAGRLYRNFRKSASEWGKTINEDISTEIEAKKDTKASAVSELNQNTKASNNQTTAASKTDKKPHEE